MWLHLLSHKRASGKIASRRLKQLLLSDRIHCPSDLTDQIQSDLMTVLDKYVEIDQAHITVLIRQQENTHHTKVPVLTICAPFKNGL